VSVAVFQADWGKGAKDMLLFFADSLTRAKRRSSHYLRAKFLSGILHKITPIYATLKMSSKKARISPDSGLRFSSRAQKIFFDVFFRKVTPYYRIGKHRKYSLRH
jgi:hypothetical protein